jgi:hypothetical protein
MEKFLTRVADHLLKKHSNNLSRVTVFFPNQRSCTYFTQTLKEVSEGVVWAPDIRTLESWVYKNSQFVLIEQLEQIIRLYQIYTRIDGSESFDEFYHVAEVLLRDFSELDVQLTDTDSFFFNLEKLQSLKVYEPGTTELSEYSIKYIAFWNMFRELYKDFRDLLAKEGTAYSGMIYRDVAENFDASIVSASESDYYYFVGFSGLTKAEEKIIEKLLLEKKAEVIPDIDSYYTDNNYNEAGYFFRKYADNIYSGSKPWKQNSIATSAVQVDVIGVAKNIGQTKVAADILANKLQLNEQSERETAIIILDEKMLPMMIGAMPVSVNAMNISMGLSIYNSPIVQLLRTVFSLRDNAMRFTSNSAKPRFYHRDVFDILHHQYFTMLSKRHDEINSFIDLCTRKNKMVIEWDKVDVVLGKVNSADFFWFTDDVSVYLNKLKNMIEIILDELIKKTNQKVTDYTADIEQVNRIQQIVNNIIRVFSSSTLQLSIETVLNILSQQFRTERIPFEGEPLQGVQLMGMQETRCLDFKNIIVLSMNEGIFPASKSSHSYIPFELRREYSLTLPRDKNAISAYLFYRLLHRAEKVFITYNTEPDELGGGERSRFVMQLQHELQEANPKAVINDWVYSVDTSAKNPSNEIVVKKEDELLATLEKKLTGYGISPSAINTYVNCSLQYYFRYMAGLREQDEIEESMEASSLGSAVHNVLDELYRERVGEKLTVEFLNKISGDKNRIAELLVASFDGKFDKESLSQGKNYLLYKVCLKLIEDFLKHEKLLIEQKEAAGISTTLLMLENEIIQPLTVNGKVVQLRGKVDRIENVGGIVNIADYKTGTPKGSSISATDLNELTKDTKYSKALQLLIYAWLYWQQNSSVQGKLRTGIYWLRQSSNGFDALKLGKNDDVVTEIVLQNFEIVLGNLLAEILNPEIPFTQTIHTERCEHCDFATICGRVGKG